MNTSFAFSHRAFCFAALFMTVGGALLMGCQQEIISHNPQSRARGMEEFQQGNYADAAGSFRNAIRSDPRDYKSQYYLAQCYQNMKQYQQAIQAYKASIDAQPGSLAGKEDEAQRLKTMESLAACISKCDTRDAETNLTEQKAKASNQPSDWLLLGMIYRERGDVDSALDAFNRAVLIDPKDFTAAKQYGLYLEQAGQRPKAVYTLRKAYTLNQKDEQVNAALSRLNVVPGPGLKDESQLVRPDIPEGPLPEVDLSKFKIGGTSSAPEEPAPTVPTGPTATPRATPAPTYTPPTAPPTAAKPVPTPGGRAISGPQD